MKTSISKFNKNKKRKGSERNGQTRNSLIPNYNLINDNNYLNFSVCKKISHAWMAEWSTQLVDTECPSGFMGSIPIPGVTNFSFYPILKKEFLEMLK